MRKLSIFLITLLLSPSLLADILPTPSPTVGLTPSVLLHKSEAAPFEGFLLPKEKVEEFRIMSIELQKEQAINTSLNTSLSLYKSNEKSLQEALNLSIDQNTKLVKREGFSDWDKVLYFGGGVVLTTLAILLGSRVSR